MVFAEHLLPAGEGLFSNHGVRNWVLQQDRGLTHTAAHRAVKKYNELGLPCVEVMPDWLGNSPDLNPIESVLGNILDKVQRTGCSTSSQLKRMVNGGYRKLDGGLVQRMMKSEPKRMQPCWASGGDKNDYCGYLVKLPSTGVSIKK